MNDSVIKTRVWLAVLGILFALLVSGVFMILQSLTTPVETGIAAAWTMSILSFAGIVASLVYGFIIDRINTIVGEIEKLQKNSPTKDHLAQVTKEAKEAVDVIRDTYRVATKGLLKAAREVGLEMVHKGRAQAEGEIEDLLKHAKREVKMLGVCISIPDRVPAFKVIVEQKANDGVTFQFAFLRRESTYERFNFYHQRSYDENYPNPPDKVGDLRGTASNNIGMIKAVRDRLDDEKKNMVQIAEYEAFPYMSLIIIDDVVFVGPYLFGENCPNTPMYRIIKVENGIYDTYHKHFTALWSSAALI